MSSPILGDINEHELSIAQVALGPPVLCSAQIISGDLILLGLSTYESTFRESTFPSACFLDLSKFV